MNIDVKSLNKILTSRIQQYMRRITYNDDYLKDARLAQYLKIKWRNPPYKQAEKENHMITSIDGEYAFDKIKTPIHRIEENFNLMKKKKSAKNPQLKSCIIMNDLILIP